LTRFETDAEEHGKTFHERVRSGYLELAAGEPKRWRVVDGSTSPETVAEAVWAVVADLFG
jgi:dTMP kinase